MARSYPQQQLDGLYKFIVGFSKKRLRFPSAGEMSEHMGLTEARIYQLLEGLITRGCVEKVGRYGYGLVKVK